ncbi:MAG TPA: hypothetical protein VF627_14090, partial [Abditibacterium sp.]
CPNDHDFNNSRFEGIKELVSPLELWNRSSDRREVFTRTQQARAILQREIDKRRVPEPKFVMGLDLNFQAPPFEVESIRPARRIGPDGQFMRDFVIEVTQSKWVALDSEMEAQLQAELEISPNVTPKTPHFRFRGGCTLIVSAEDYEVRYCIVKRFDLESTRLKRQRAWLSGRTDASPQATYFGSSLMGGADEPFALLHRALEDEQP